MTRKDSRRLRCCDQPLPPGTAIPRQVIRPDVGEVGHLVHAALQGARHASFRPLRHGPAHSASMLATSQARARMGLRTARSGSHSRIIHDTLVPRPRNLRSRVGSDPPPWRLRCRERCGAVAQKSPCEGNRVIMGQESPIKLGQRGQDARQEVPMRTPKQLYAQERIIYQPDLLTCPHCGDLLVMCTYLAWDKTVQMLDRVLSVASRPGRCPHATCAGSRMRLLSAEGQRIALRGSSYGYDVLVRIGWWRQEYRATYSEIHTELASQVRISESHVRYLYQHLYLPLLACHERQHHDYLAQIATQQGGLIVALDGLAPQGGEPQIWFIRELSSGLTLRSGWLCHQDQPTFEAFLAPLKHLEWPILAVLSDKQTGLMPAVAAVLPN